jgi:Xaa-Pro aminopeptidase
MKELEGFKHAQKIAYEAAVEVSRGLSPGITEKEAAKRLGEALRRRGVVQYFHAPFAWFGERSKLAGLHGISPKFFPSGLVLERRMIAILDVAPIVDGFTSDIGYTFTLSEKSDPLSRARDTLAEIRQLIPTCVSRGDTMRSIYVRIDRLLESRGYDNRHSHYPFAVIGHRVERAVYSGRELHLGRFGLSSAIRVLGGELVSKLAPGVAHSPFWNAGDQSNEPLSPGLWAIEPHLGAEGFGAKFEEILVVEPHRAYWLDDDLPHVLS